MLLRNSFYNLLGLGLPLLVAVVAIPALIHSLGVERFGILTIIWAVVSYFGLFDFGLGRAVTQQVAASIAAGDLARLKGVVGTSTALMMPLGVVAAMLMALAAPWLAWAFAGDGNQTEIVHAFYWMALAMPAIVLTSGYRGTLEALGRFGLVNAIRFPMGVFTFAGPLAVIWSGYPRLDIISAVLCVGRIVACLAHAMGVARTLPEGVGRGHFDRSLIGPMLSMGGWISISNVISPLMNYVDRFLLGFMVSAAAVAYYATPQELILRVSVIPAAVAAALFPLFAATGASDDRNGNGKLLKRYSLLIMALMLPLTIALFVFAKPMLTWWISPSFAQEAAPVLQIMSIAGLISGLAQVPFSLLQGRGRADLTAKLHIAEFPLFLGLIYILVTNYGPVGAAWAWLTRISLDLAGLWVLSLRHVNQDAAHHPIDRSSK